MSRHQAGTPLFYLTAVIAGIGIALFILGVVIYGPIMVGVGILLAVAGWAWEWA